MPDQERRDTETNVKREPFASNSETFLKFLMIVLIVLAIGNFVRSFYVEDATDRATDAAESIEDTASEGRDASVDVLATLDEILATLEEGPDQPDLNNQAIIDALITIDRIEFYLCGGACPVPTEP